MFCHGVIMPGKRRTPCLFTEDGYYVRETAHEITVHSGDMFTEDGYSIRKTARVVPMFSESGNYARETTI